MIYTIYRSEKREDLFKWIGPITPPTRIYLVKLKSRKLPPINSVEDIKKYKVGVLLDDQSHQFLPEFICIGFYFC